MLLYASKYGDVRTVVNVSGRYDLNGGLELRLGKNFMEVIKKQGYMDIKDKTGIESVCMANSKICIRDQRRHGYIMFQLFWHFSPFTFLTLAWLLCL